MSSSFNTISNALSTEYIIVIVISSIIGLAICIGTIICIVCIIKHLNRPRNSATRGMVLQQGYPYPHPHSWSNQYPPTTVSVANYPPTFQTVSPPYIASAPNY